ncbi:DUF1657 domain-containing protein [Metallumcola ferriviriculae]|uniref:DUF1657 domain-containing protein n=1 Tax=Metallumcola ferriviriculae TaxID=3039180 RepID=A0AAU0URT1_9FIRM|nr:DUF1657 domain-containing protein [Desulfitibacteraceae bacterium MK1]
MTVGQQLHQTLGMLRTAGGQLQTYSLQTMDPQAKQFYNSCSQQLEQMVNDLSNRVNYVEQQEPTYKVNEMAQQQAAQNQNQQQSQRQP